MFTRLPGWNQSANAPRTTEDIIRGGWYAEWTSPSGSGTLIAGI